PGEIRPEVDGYITFMQAIAGKTPVEISKILGLRPTDLTSGAMIYRLNRIPHDHEFEVRGMTTLVDGKALPDGQTQDAGGYRAGTGALQYEVLRKAAIPATLLGQLRPGEAFDLRTIRRPGASATVFSGAEWWRANEHQYSNSAQISDLAPAFATAVGSFIRAMEAGGATVLVAATLRNRLRAYLMHYSWRVARRDIAPVDVPFERDVPIIWDHGNEAASRKAAQEMVDLFGIVYRPSLTSNHIVGRAVDMKITWAEPFLLTDARGKEVMIDRPRRDAANTSLHKVGASYGVRKLLTDAPHWSFNGH
ncbi:MAG TPA: hypothetical protein VKB08_04205, partial [Bradyrhizobium sp.]|nr:hypothetical protein [Bradyrhizobium sp.]